MIVIFILACLLILIGIILLFTNRYYMAFVCGVVGAYVASGALIFIEEDQNPSAMDVYQGKTTLKITYKGGIPIDSIVVFKNEEYADTLVKASE